MSEKQTETSNIREYLLGNSSSSNEELEEKLMTDDDFFQEFLIEEEELIQDYADENLTNSEKKQFENYFLISEERREKVLFAQTLRKQIDQKENTKNVETITKETQNPKGSNFFSSFFSSPIPVAVCLIIIAGLSTILIWNNYLKPSDNEIALASLNKAFKNERPLESRISEFDYASKSNTRGDNGSNIDKIELENAEYLIRKNARENPNAENLHALGRFYLTMKEFDKAIEELKKAEKLNVKDSQIYNDLGVAFMEKAISADLEKQGEEFFKATNASLQNFNKALELNNNYLEALFNRALLLSSMRIPNQARIAWEKYLEVDSTSLWADEARKHIKLLGKQNLSKEKSEILEDFLESYRNKNETRSWQIVQETKEFATGAMLSQQLAKQYLELIDNGQINKARENLSAFVYLGQIEMKYTDDNYFSELADYYKNASFEKRRKLLEAHNLFQQAQTQLFKPDFKESLRIYTQARNLFSSIGNKWEAGITEYLVCYSLTQLNRINESNNLLFALSDFSEQRNYKWLQSIAEGWIASNYLILGEISKSIKYDRKSLNIAERISDAYKIQRGHIGLADQYLKIDNEQKSLNNIYQSLTFPNKYHLSLRQNWRNLFFTAEILYAFKLYDIALYYAHEEVVFAQEQLKDNWIKHSALIQSSMIYRNLKKNQEAISQVEASLSLAEDFPDKEMQQKLRGKSLISLANLQRESGDCRAAIKNYDEAIELHKGMEFVVRLYEAQKGRLLCLIDQNDMSSVDKEMPLLLNFFDQNRKKIAEESDRNIYFDNEQDVYDIATDYSFTKLNNQEKAFDYAENSRARSLLSLMQDDAQEASLPLSLIDIRKHIPEEVQLVYYAVLKDKLLIWYVSGKKLEVIEKLINQAELEQKIFDYSKALINRSDKNDIQNRSEELYEIVLKPIDDNLQRNKTICFVADKTLFRLSFASLISPANKKYLIEDYPILLAPSATIFVKQTELAKRKQGKLNEKLLSIGNPTFSKQEYSLRDLPAATDEAIKIASFYENPLVLTEKVATKKKILDKLYKSEIIHFAGHYLPNLKSPALSKLIFASSPSSKDSDDLSVGEIIQNKLPNARLMVLAACDSGVENYYQGEGMIGAARAFLASDVPLVIASQWAVDSDATAELMVNFHRYRKQNSLQSIGNLRQAQISMIHSENSNYNHPYYWAGFLPIGGYTEF